MDQYDRVMDESRQLAIRMRSISSLIQMELVLPVCSTPRMPPHTAWMVTPKSHSLITLPKRLRLSLENAKGRRKVPQAIITVEEKSGDFVAREQAVGSG